MKIAVFGGTFNPPHLTHVNIARQTVSQLGVDKLIIFPCGDPPHKKCGLSAIHRLNMTKLAFKDIPCAEVDTFEMDNAGKSYTLNTLQYVRNKYPDAQLYLVIGGDSLRDLDKWHCPEEIVKLATLVVACRKDVELEQTAAEKQKEYNCNIEFLDVVADDVSSTEIRLQQQFNMPLKGVAEEVRRYINDNNLYSDYQQLTAKLKGYLKPQRFSHTFYVTLKGLELPRTQCSEQQVFLACALHDCAKYIGKDKYPIYGFSNDDNLPEPVVHAFLGAKVARQDFGIEDKMVLDAIEFHTTARPDMTELDMIVYVADKTEKSRPFPTAHLFAPTLKETFFNTMVEAYEILKSRYMSVSPLTEQAIRYYEKQLKE